MAYAQVHPKIISCPMPWFINDPTECSLSVCNTVHLSYGAIYVAKRSKNCNNATSTDHINFYMRLL